MSSPAVAFLEQLRPTGPWTLTALYEGSAACPTICTSTPAEAEQFLVEHQWANCYYQANVARDVGKRPKLDDFEYCEWAHVDIDYDAEGNRLSTPERRAPVIEALRQCQIGPPTAIVTTGNGIQALWRVVRMDCQSSAAISFFRDINTSLAEMFGGDNIPDASHLLRLPGTINWPNAKKRQIGLTPGLTSLESFSSQPPLDILSFPAPKRHKETTKVDVQIGAPEPVTLEQLIASGVSRRAVDAILTGSHETSRQDLTRSECVWYVCCVMAQAGISPERMLYVLLNTDWGISESVYDQVARTPEAYAMRQITRALQRQWDELLEGLPDTPFVPLVQAPARKRFELLTYSQLAHEPEPEWIIDQWLQENVVSQIFGESGNFKTFVAIDMCLCIATGRPWRGEQVKQGKVTYVLGEGKQGFYKRLRAWVRQNNLTDEEMRAVEENFAVIQEPIYVDDDGGTGALTEFFRIHKDYRPSLIVLDTLNRNMLGGENDIKDMSRVVRGCDALSRHTKGTVLLVHHTGWNNKDRERGSSGLRGAMNQVIRVEADKGQNRAVVKTTVTLVKNKDGKEGMLKVLCATQAHGSIVFPDMVAPTEEELVLGCAALGSKGLPDISGLTGIESRRVKAILANTRWFTSEGELTSVGKEMGDTALTHLGVLDMLGIPKETVDSDPPGG
jgi:hypothetical protein